VHYRVAELIRNQDELAVTEPVLAEVLIGARNERRERDLRRLLGSFQMLHFEVPVDFDGAVQIYRRCRSVGVTPRGLLDCMIAAVTRRYGADLLAYDADITRVAGVVGITLDVTAI